MATSIPASRIRADRLDLLEYLATCAIRVAYRLANDDGVMATDNPLLWALHDVASQYECYEAQRQRGFPPRPGGLPQYPTLEALFADWERMGVYPPQPM